MNKAAQSLVNLRWSKIPKGQRSDSVGHSGGRHKTYPQCVRKYHRFNNKGICYYCRFERPLMTDREQKELDRLRQETERNRCPDCGESYDLEPCNWRHANVQSVRNSIRTINDFPFTVMRG